MKTPTHIGPTLRSFPGGYEARTVTEPNGIRAPWILLDPLGMICRDLERAGIINAPVTTTAPAKRPRVKKRSKRT